LGLDPIVYPAAYARNGFLAGTDRERAGDLQTAFDDPSIDGIWALRGGYGTLRILHRLDLSRQERDPVPFIGFSDNSTIHALHARLGVISFHGPHPGTTLLPETLRIFRRSLFSAEPPGHLEARPEDPEPQGLTDGRVEATLVGGNLSMLASLCGSDALPATEGRILFLEDTGEPAYRIDRLLTQLQRAGVLDSLVGLALGRFTTRRDEDVPEIADVLREFAEGLGVPAVSDLPFGHVPHNCIVPVGGMAILDARDASMTISEPVVNGAQRA